MRRAALLVLAACALAGCGSGSGEPAAPPDPAAPLRQLVRGEDGPLAALPDDAPVHARRVGGDWAVAWTVAGGEAYAVAERLRNGRWVAEPAGPVTLRPLGPDPGSTAAALPQVAVELKAPKPIVDTSLLVDGVAIDTRGGGPSSNYITIYGAPAAPLASGEHVAVAFARAGAKAGAVAWRFAVG